MLRQCCVCKRIDVEGRWVHPTRDQRQDPNISHGYCDDCFEVCKQQFLAHQQGHRSNWRQRLGRMMLRAIHPSAPPLHPR